MAINPQLRVQTARRRTLHSGDVTQRDSLFVSAHIYYRSTPHDELPIGNACGLFYVSAIGAFPLTSPYQSCRNFTVSSGHCRSRRMSSRNGKSYRRRSYLYSSVSAGIGHPARRMAATLARAEVLGCQRLPRLADLVPPPRMLFPAGSPARVWRPPTGGRTGSHRLLEQQR